MKSMENHPDTGHAITNFTAQERRPNRALYARPCEACGESFHPRRADTRFCTPTCRVRHHRAVAKAATSAPEGSVPGDYQRIVDKYQNSAKTARDWADFLEGHKAATSWVYEARKIKAVLEKDRVK